MNVNLDIFNRYYKIPRSQPFSSPKDESPNSQEKNPTVANPINHQVTICNHHTVNFFNPPRRRRDHIAQKLHIHNKR